MGRSPERRNVMPASKAQQKATNKYIAKAYDRVNLTLPKGQKEAVQAHATARSESVNGFIGRAISETMERDSGGQPSESPQDAPESTTGAGVVSFFYPLRPWRSLRGLLRPQEKVCPNL